MARNSGARAIKLFCPLVSKLVQWPTWEEERLDLGSIARAFGLDPATLKLNGHYISRGVDLVSHSVTWRSLLSFFSAKGLPNGKDERSALIVDGKLSKVGSKSKFFGIWLLFPSLSFVFFFLCFFLKKKIVKNVMEKEKKFGNTCIMIWLYKRK